MTGTRIIHLRTICWMRCKYHDRNTWRSSGASFLFLICFSANVFEYRTTSYRFPLGNNSCTASEYVIFPRGTCPLWRALSYFFFLLNFSLYNQLFEVFFRSRDSCPLAEGTATSTIASGFLCSNSPSEPERDSYKHHIKRISLFE